MITTILIGLGVLFAIATVVTMVSRFDIARAANRRFNASERRENWERRQHHVAGPSWGDEDSD